MSSAALSANRPQLVIPALGIIQILNWGATYYLPAAIGRQMANATGWSYAVIIGGLSLGLGVAGLNSARIGRLIDRHGGRPVLTVASLLMALGLIVLALAPNEGCYFAAWIILGFGMGAGLYDAAFSTLGRLYGQGARRAISTLTLWSGFASTICWPLSAFLFEHLGWRGTCLVYAVLELIICIPLIRGLLPDIPKAVDTVDTVDPDTRMIPAAEPPALDHRRATFALLATVLTMGGVVTALVSVHLITMLQASNMSYAAAVGVSTLLGPAQVFSRVLERVFGSALHPIWVMLTACMMVTAGLLLLLVGPSLAAVALIAYGAGAGIWSIARGTLPLALFGSKGYPALMGKLATPMLIAQALSPSVGAFMMDGIGVALTEIVLCGVSVLCVVGNIALYLVARRSVEAYA
jgi:predicted MFS family arabinose efflux permease